MLQKPNGGSEVSGAQRSSKPQLNELTPKSAAKSPLVALEREDSVEQQEQESEHVGNRCG